MKKQLITLITIVALGMQAASGVQMADLKTRGELTESELTKQAMIVGEAGHWDQAEHVLRSYLDKHPGSAMSLFTLGRVQFHEDKPKESLLTYTKAAKGNTPGPGDLYIVGLDYVLLNDYGDADKWMTRSVEMNGSDGEAWYSLGRIKYTENRFQESIAGFEKAIALMPKSVKVENNLGLAYEGLNRPDDAIAAYRQALGWQQGNAVESEQPYLNLGKLLTDRNAFDEALALLQRAQAIAPGDSKIHAALGKLYARRQQFGLAQSQFEQALRAEPNDAGLHFQLGQVFRRQGLQALAKQELERSAQLAGTHSVESNSTEVMKENP